MVEIIQLTVPLFCFYYARFDLLFLLLDKADMDSDLALAQHVTYVHRYGHHPPLETETFSAEFIRTYISQSRKLHPTVPASLSEYIVTAYSNMRREEAKQSAQQQFTYTTARTLLAILRLSTALVSIFGQQHTRNNRIAVLIFSSSILYCQARVRFDEEVKQSDVDEAMRLMHVSKSSLLETKESHAYVLSIHLSILSIFLSLSFHFIQFPNDNLI